MNVQVKPTPETKKASALGIIDCDVHPLPRSHQDIRKYLPRGWRAHFDEYPSNIRQPFVNSEPYPRAAPFICRRDAYPPAGGPPGSDLAFMQQQLLDPYHIDIGVLQLLGFGLNQRNAPYGAALCGATNLWQLQEWLEQDSRLRGTIAVPQDWAEGAVAEIRRHGRDKAFVQVGVMQRTMEPLGSRRYWPIFAAAVEHDLPIGVHTGGYNGNSPVAGGGWPSYYAEQHHAINMAQQSVLTSLVMEGVFEHFPSLRVMLVEGGFTWAPSLAWRLDNIWERMRSEVPHVRRPPSEYIREHVWFSTQPIDYMGSPEELRQVCEWTGFERLCFSSDYPHWDFDDPNHVFTFQLTQEEKTLVFRDNARKLYRLD